MRYRDLLEATQELWERQWPQTMTTRVCETFAWTEDAMREFAAEVVNDNSDGSPAYFDPNEGHWRYDPAFPLSAFTWIMSPDEWREWIVNEVEMLTGDLGHDRGYTAMHSEEIIEPIVVSLYHGKAYIWDGFHRIGVSLAKGAKTIKAIVGERSSSTTMMEGNTSDLFIERLADTILRTFAERIPEHLKGNLRRYGKHYAKQYGEEALRNPEFLGRLSIGEMAERMPEQTAAEQRFFAHASKITVGFKFDQPGYVAAYYQDMPHNKDNFILVKLPDDTMDAMVSTLLQRKVLRPAAVLTALSVRRSELVHELRHAYDDVLSQGKYMQNSRSQAAAAARHAASPDATALYFNDPIEISARLTASLAHNASHVREPFAAFAERVRHDFARWDDVPAPERRKLTKRIASYYLNQRAKRNALP